MMSVLELNRLRPRKKKILTIPKKRVGGDAEENEQQYVTTCATITQSRLVYKRLPYRRLHTFAGLQHRHAEATERAHGQNRNNRIHADTDGSRVGRRSAEVKHIARHGY